MISLRALQVGDRPLERYVRVFLPDGTEIPNVIGMQLARADGRPRVVLEIDNCTFEWIEVAAVPEQRHG